MRVVLLPVICVLAASACAGSRKNVWADAVLDVPYAVQQAARAPVVQLVRQDYEQLELNRSVIKTPMVIGSKRFEHGLGTHSVSHIRVYSPEPIERFSARFGVDNNERTGGSRGSVAFSVCTLGREVFRSGILRGGQEPEKLDIELGGARTFDLHVGDGGDGPGWDHADWAEATIILQGGTSMRLDEMKIGTAPVITSRYPFSFLYGGKPSDDILEFWREEDRTERLDGDRTRLTTIWTDPATGLRLTWEVVRYSDFPALDWVLHFENTGNADTPIIGNVQTMDLTFDTPPYRLHKAHGGTPNPEQFEPASVAIDERNSDSLGSGNGRSSTLNFPFFKLETGRGSVVAAIGWSGTWQALFECPDGRHLRATAGMEKTHFVLRPGEKVRSPRILVLHWEGDTLEANAQFRQLVYKHYAAKRSGKAVPPIVFCNTCFTRGGGWLNECNAENQVSLIKAYAPMGLEALITDAGWFEGGWPSGAGNWNPRKDAYPQGMGPVALAAKEHGMVYGLWFEPERVVAGTGIHKEHPEWCLASQKDPQDTYLLNFGLPEVQDYFFNIVRGFMDLPGFRFYRQDFNMDPLPYWRFNDAPDRQGITEMKYVEGLYACWDRIARTWLDSIREECASGGHRIDLETVTRMHAHQTTDYWFNDEVNQAALWSISQYLPNGVVSVPINRLDDYSFHSALASSLIPGWIADAPDFDAARGKALLERYRELRHLLVGAWYPLLPYSRDGKDWMASQYHRPDLDEGMILAFRHPDSPYLTAEIALHGLDPDAAYELTYDSDGSRKRRSGAELMRSFRLTIPEKRGSELIVYLKAN